MANFILIAVFTFGYGPRVNYAQLGEFTTIESCRAAAQTISIEAKALDLIGHQNARFVCAKK